jgi:hypothetical protein
MPEHLWADELMRQAEIESWVLGILSTVASGGRVKDSRVELEATWPDPIK